MLEPILKQAIPNQLSVFDKFTAGLDPYHFASWDKDGNTVILRYWFWNRTKTKKNRKRIIINELEGLLKHAIVTGGISRQHFEEYCPLSSRDGSCGFAVIIGILKHFQAITGVDGEYRLVAAERIEQLLN